MRTCLLLTAATLVLARHSTAQQVSGMAQAIPLVTTATHTAAGQTLTEGYLTQPVVMGHAAWGPGRAVGTLDLEGLTLERGELNTGGYGEGYVDRRHPHAYVHELLLGAEAHHLSIFAGRGFAPFGSDDPMMRPFEKYPVNHHLAQVLERIVAIGAVQYRGIIGEVGTFNGDEPLGPGAPPNFSRFGDSWAARLTALPLTGFEVSGSVAAVASPELRAGHGLDQRKSSVTARFTRVGSGWSNYLFGEWAHTNERERAQPVASLSSWLFEGARCRAGLTIAGRIERTDRPEEERLTDPFRTPRPASDLSNLGLSRWTTTTVSIAAPAIATAWLSSKPFIEIARASVTEGATPGLFSPELRYGARRMWMVSAGVRLQAGMSHGRMGRYGAALPSDGTGMPGMTMPGMDMPDHETLMTPGAAEHRMTGICDR